MEKSYELITTQSSEKKLIEERFLWYIMHFCFNLEMVEMTLTNGTKELHVVLGATGGTGSAVIDELLKQSKEDV